MLSSSQQLRDRRRAGATLIVALMVLCILAVLGVSFAVSVDRGLRKSTNHRLVVAAEMAAESGTAYFAHVLQSAEITDVSSGQAILDSLATALDGQLSGSLTLQGQAVAYDGSTVTVPAIGLGDGRSFTTEITGGDGQAMRLTVVGRAPSADAPGGAVERSVNVELELAAETAFEYGIFAKGPINIGMNFDYTGANDPAEASLFSAAGGIAIAVDSGEIDGDVITYEPGATVIMGANVGGRIYVSDSLPEPEVDGSVFEPFATNIVDAGTDTSGGTFTNIRVRASTDPFFGPVTILGVMYIEAPNVVTFKNNAEITGVVVSEDPGLGASLDHHRVYFKNNLTVRGLDELPNTPDFATLRTMGGSAFLLPGFALEFKNNFTSISGTVAAQQIVAKNNLSGTVYGSIISLGSGGLTFKNDSSITIDRSKYPDPAPGLIPGQPRTLILQPASYLED